MEEVCRYFYTINCENIILTSDFLSNEEQQERFKKLVKDKKVLELAEKKIKKIKDEQSTCLTCMAY